jgi:two-component system, OmpR family, phosphate regulon response regulator PhoB
MEPSSALSTPDLLILGDRLRDMTGLHLCQELRRRGVNLPILIASHNSSETDRVVGLELGADDYLVRPFSLRELVARVRALLRGRKIAATSGEEVLSFEDLMLYPTARRVVRQNQPVSLAPKEFKLLATLMAQPDRVWSRNDLLDAVWGIDYIGDVKTVDVHIRWLREKLEANPAHPRYIKTVRGFGYRLGG